MKLGVISVEIVSPLLAPEPRMVWRVVPINGECHILLGFVCYVTPKIGLKLLLREILLYFSTDGGGAHSRCLFCWPGPWRRLTFCNRLCLTCPTV